MTTGADLLASGARIGELVWVESRLFEATGRWVDTTPEPAARVVLATLSGHHGWRAEVLSTLLPQVAGGPTITELVVPGAGFERPEADLDGAADTVARLELWTSLATAVVAACGDHIEATTAIAEGAAHRLLRIVAADVREDIGAVERFLSSSPR